MREGGGPRGNRCSQGRRPSQASTGSGSHPEQTQWEPDWEKPQLWCSNPLDAPCRQVWELKSPGGHHHSRPPQPCRIYLQGLSQVPTVKIRGKLPHAPSSGKGKGTMLKYTRHISLGTDTYTLQYVKQTTDKDVSTAHCAPVLSHISLQPHGL